MPWSSTAWIRWANSFSARRRNACSPPFATGCPGCRAATMVKGPLETLITVGYRITFHGWFGGRGERCTTEDRLLPSHRGATFLLVTRSRTSASAPEKGAGLMLDRPNSSRPWTARRSIGRGSALVPGQPDTRRHQGARPDHRRSRSDDQGTRSTSAPAMPRGSSRTPTRPRTSSAAGQRSDLEARS